MQQKLAKITKLNRRNHQTVKLHYVCAVDYNNHQLNDSSTLYDDSNFCLIPKIVKRMCSLINAFAFEPLDPNLYLGFITTFELACRATRIQNDPSVWKMLCIVADRVLSPLNSRMIQNERTRVLASTVSLNGVIPLAPRLKTYSEVVTHLYRSYASNKAISKANATIIRFALPAGMTLSQFCAAHFSNAVFFEDVYHEGALNNTQIKKKLMSSSMLVIGNTPQRIPTLTKLI